MDENDLRKFVKDWLYENHKTQTGLATLCNISKSYLGDFLLGKRSPPKKMLEYFGIKKVVLYEHSR